MSKVLDLPVGFGFMGPRGGPDDPCPAMNGGGAVNDLLTEGDACNIKQKPFLRPHNPGTEWGGTMSSTPLKPGTLCTFFAGDPVPGSPHYVVAGCVPTNTMSGNLPGNFSYNSYMNLVSSQNHPWYIFTQKLKKDSRDGVPVEKTHSPKMVTYNSRNRNLPNGPIPQRSVPFLGPMTNCFTAITSFMSVFSGFLSGLAGGIPMNAGNVLQKIKQNANNANTIISSNVSPEIMNVLMALADNAPAADTTITPGYMCDTRANSTIYLQNAVNLFSQCKTPYEVLTAYTMLDTMPQFKGQNTLPGVSFTANGISGSASYTLSANGMMSAAMSANANTQMQQTLQTMSNGGGGSGGGGFPGGMPGLTMFGGSGGTLLQMLTRIHPAAGAARKMMMMSVVADALHKIDGGLFHAGGDFLNIGINMAQKIPAIGTFAKFAQLGMNFSNFIPANLSGILSKVQSMVKIG